VRGAFVLGISVAAFILLGLVRFDATAIVLLAGVVVVHELGHLAAMRVFGYGNLRMFLIPLFGGAASGRKAGAPGWQRAIVALAGPLPGLLIGYALLVAYLYADAPPVATAGVLFLGLNALNLLPLFPLDGGRFMNDVLFARHRHVETGFKAMAALGLIGLGVLAKDGIVGAFGGFMLVAAILSARLGAIADELRPQLANADPSGDIPPADVARIAAAVRRRLRTEDAAVVARAVDGVWERLIARPPGVAATLGLLLVYLGSIASVPVVPAFILGLVVAGALPTPSSGSLAEYVGALERERETRATIDYAALAGDVESLRRYLGAGGDVERRDREGDTLLMSSAWSGCLECVRLLVEGGADVNGRDRYGGTALTSAVAGRHDDVLWFLVQSGADVNVRSPGGLTPLIESASGWSLASVELLLGAGADPNRRGSDGRTALDHAESRPADDPERAAIVTRLLDAGARRGRR
jgi:Zn-dependent protease